MDLKFSNQFLKDYIFFIIYVLWKIENNWEEKFRINLNQFLDYLTFNVPILINDML